MAAGARPVAALGAAALMLAATASRASVITVCDVTAPNVCGATLVGGNAGVAPPNDTFGGVAGPDGASFQSAGGGSMSQFGAGVGGLTANASGSGTFGEIHLSAFADNGQFSQPVFFSSDGSATTFAFAEILFVDGAIVPGALGAPVTLSMNLTVNGAFSGGGQVGGDFAFSDPSAGISLVQDFGATEIGPSFAFPLTFNVFGGDQLFWRMDMTAEAGTTNSGGLVQTSIADVSHTGRLFFDLPSGDGLVGLSGHNYASVLPTDGVPPIDGGVPEPATWAMLLVGFGGMGAVLRRARRGQARPV
jgi:hypothetical protein